MKRLVVWSAVIINMMGICMTANAREVTTLDMDYDETINVIQGVVEEPEVAEEVTEETVIESEPETGESEFTGNYGSSAEDEWVDMEPEDCPEHIWEYSYDDDEDSTGEDGDIVYFRFCLNCGYTEELDECPDELAYTLSDEGSGE